MKYSTPKRNAILLSNGLQEGLVPSKSRIDFLLNYSKSLEVVKLSVGSKFILLN